MGPDSSLPYFDQLLAALEAGDPALQRCFGRHVHWGWWDQASLADRVAGPTTDEFAEASEALCQQVLGRAQIQPGEQVLDVGCGFGGTIASLNDSGHNLTLVGLNLDPRQLAQARRLVQPRSGNAVRWVEADASALPFADASLDVVLAVECIFHFPSRASFFDEAARVLKPGGRLVLSDFVPISPLAQLWGWGRRGGPAAVFNRTFGPVDCSWDRHRYAREGHRRALALAGDDDVTANTLPTYPIVRQLFAAMGASQAVADTAVVERLSRWGLLRYRILRFHRQQKEESPAGSAR